MWVTWRDMHAVGQVAVCSSSPYLRAFSHQVSASPNFCSFWQHSARLVRQATLMSLLARICTAATRKVVDKAPGRLCSKASSRRGIQKTCQGGCTEPNEEAGTAAAGDPTLCCYHSFHEMKCMAGACTSSGVVSGAPQPAGKEIQQLGRRYMRTTAISHLEVPCSSEALPGATGKAWHLEHTQLGSSSAQLPQHQADSSCPSHNRR